MTAHTQKKLTENPDSISFLMIFFFFGMILLQINAN